TTFRVWYHGLGSPPTQTESQYLDSLSLAGGDPSFRRNIEEQLPELLRLAKAAPLADTREKASELLDFVQLRDGSNVPTDTARQPPPPHSGPSSPASSSLSGALPPPQPLLMKHGVDGSECSMKIFLSEVEEFCPILPFRQHLLRQNESVAWVNRRQQLRQWRRGSRERQSSWLALPGLRERVNQLWQSLASAAVEGGWPDRWPRRRVLAHVGYLSQPQHWPPAEAAQWADLLGRRRAAGTPADYSTTPPRHRRQVRSVAGKSFASTSAVAIHAGEFLSRLGPAAACIAKYDKLALAESNCSYSVSAIPYGKDGRILSVAELRQAFPPAFGFTTAVSPRTAPGCAGLRCQSRLAELYPVQGLLLMSMVSNGGGIFVGLGFPYEHRGTVGGRVSRLPFLNLRFKPPLETVPIRITCERYRVSRKLRSQDPYLESLGEPASFLVDLEAKHLIPATLARGSRGSRRRLRQRELQRAKRFHGRPPIWPEFEPSSRRRLFAVWRALRTICQLPAGPPSEIPPTLPLLPQPPLPQPRLTLAEGRRCNCSTWASKAAHARDAAYPRLNDPFALRIRWRQSPSPDIVISCRTSDCSACDERLNGYSRLCPCRRLGLTLARLQPLKMIESSSRIGQSKQKLQLRSPGRMYVKACYGRWTSTWANAVRYVYKGKGGLDFGGTQRQEKCASSASSGARVTRPHGNCGSCRRASSTNLPRRRWASRSESWLYRVSYLIEWF
uniref:alpha-1,6-mannosyl-glycoprotein 6-beta-N-acetylglucosaminyltransferase n=1 Tax=Macrostomum lignano TaxID=282301 RepID=A0A1I8JRB4_9PLAT